MPVYIQKQNIIEAVKARLSNAALFEMAENYIIGRAESAHIEQGGTVDDFVFPEISESEISAMFAEVANEAFEEIDANIQISAIKKALEPTIAEIQDSDIDDYIGLVDPFLVGESVTTGVRRRFDGVIYKCLQPHTTQIDWTPDLATSLWVKARNPEVIEPWVQPAGAHDAYAIGERVTHDNPNDNNAIWVYESAINANTTEPGRDGIYDRYWTPINKA